MTRTYRRDAFYNWQAACERAARAFDQRALALQSDRRFFRAPL